MTGSGRATVHSAVPNTLLAIILSLGFMACGLIFDSGFQGSAESSPTVAICQNTVQLEHMTWLNPSYT
jgi:hypothetical protein